MLDCDSSEIEFYLSDFSSVMNFFLLSGAGRIFFVQIGANDGVMDDPLRPYLERYPVFSGIFVEPQKEECRKLRRIYDGFPQFSIECAAIASKSGYRNLIKVRKDRLDKDWYRGLATLMPERGLISKMPAENLDVERVKAMTFHELLEKHDVSNVDLLQIDVEGMEREIIKSIDLKGIRPAIINYETRHLTIPERRECLLYLNAMGYAVFHYDQDYNSGNRKLDKGVNAVAV